MTVVTYGVDHGADGLLNVAKGYGSHITPPAVGKGGNSHLPKSLFTNPSTHFTHTFQPSSGLV